MIAEIDPTIILGSEENSLVGPPNSICTAWAHSANSISPNTVTASDGMHGDEFDEDFDDDFDEDFDDDFEDDLDADLDDDPDDDLDDDDDDEFEEDFDDSEVVVKSDE